MSSAGFLVILPRGSVRKINSFAPLRLSFAQAPVSQSFCDLHADSNDRGDEPNISRQFVTGSEGPSLIGRKWRRQCLWRARSRRSSPPKRYSHGFSIRASGNKHDSDSDANGPAKKSENKILDALHFPFSSSNRNSPASDDEKSSDLEKEKAPKKNDHSLLEALHLPFQNVNRSPPVSEDEKQPAESTRKNDKKLLDALHLPFSNRNHQAEPVPVSRVDAAAHADDVDVTTDSPKEEVHESKEGKKKDMSSTVKSIVAALRAVLADVAEDRRKRVIARKQAREEAERNNAKPAKMRRRAKSTHHNMTWLPEDDTIDFTKTKFTVFGGGSFGTALSWLLANKGIEVMMLVRDEHVVRSINEDHRNPKYLSDFVLPDNITATTDAEEALHKTNYILHAIPVQYSSDFLRKVAPLIPETVPIVSTSKGLEVHTLELMSDIIPRALGRPDHPLAFISGPSFAKEVIQNYPTAVVVASHNRALSKRIQKVFHCPKFRVYTSTDVVGVEAGGALKNVLAIGAGALQGLDLGSNAMASLVTRGLAEIRKLSVAMGGRPGTVSGLSGVGDVYLTCTGALSRNRQVGERLGRGESLEQILSSMNGVAEGVATAAAVLQVARRYGLHLPILFTVAEVLSGKLAAKDAEEKIMNLPMPGDEEDVADPDEDSDSDCESHDEPDPAASSSSSRRQHTYAEIHFEGVAAPKPALLAGPRAPSAANHVNVHLNVRPSSLPHFDEKAATAALDKNVPFERSLANSTAGVSPPKVQLPMSPVQLQSVEADPSSSPRVPHLRYPSAPE